MTIPKKKIYIKYKLMFAKLKKKIKLDLLIFLLQP